MLSSSNTSLSASNHTLEAPQAQVIGGSTLNQSNPIDGPHPWEQALRLVQQRQSKLRETMGPVNGEELAKLSGLQAMTALLEGRSPVFAMGRTLNFHLIEVKFGEVIFQGLPGENAYNTLGVVHAGWFASVLESALSGAIHSLLSSGQWCTTSDFNLHLINGVNPQTGPLRAKGSALHMGAQSASARAELIDITGKLYAHASASFKIHSVPDPTQR
jgi:uncharacterized protein (TIGR00369 family)